MPRRAPQTRFPINCSSTVRNRKYVTNTDLARIGFGQSVAVTAVQMAAACCRRLDYLRQENDKLQDKIAQIRLVDRAKCYLIEHKGMSEAEAHRMIEKTAMDTRRDRAEVAAEILEEE